MIETTQAEKNRLREQVMNILEEYVKNDRFNEADNVRNGFIDFARRLNYTEEEFNDICGETFKIIFDARYQATEKYQWEQKLKRMKYFYEMRNKIKDKGEE